MRRSALSVFLGVFLASFWAAGQQAVPPGQAKPGTTATQTKSEPSHQPSAPQPAPRAASPPPQPTPAKPKHLEGVAWQTLVDASGSDKTQERSDAISALSILGSDRRSIELVTKALDDDDQDIRSQAARSLGDMKARAAIPALRKTLDDPSPVVSFDAAQALWKMHDRSGRDLFYDVLLGQRKARPGMVERHIEQVKKDIHDPKTLALIGINQASGAFLGPFSMGVSMVEEYAKSTSAPVEALCADLLSADNTPDTVDELSLALGDKNWAVRAAAAKSLAKMNRVEMIPQLTEMMNTDKDEPARLVAAAAIVKLNSRSSAATRRAEAKPD